MLWDFSLYQPHVVVINLGTNDFGPADPGTPFETAYVSFVQAIRTKYPDTHPNVAGQQGMGNALAARIRVVMGW